MGFIFFFDYLFQQERNSCVYRVDMYYLCKMYHISPHSRTASLQIEYLQSICNECLSEAAKFEGKVLVSFRTLIVCALTVPIRRIVNPLVLWNQFQCVMGMLKFEMERKVFAYFDFCFWLKLYFEINVRGLLIISREIAKFICTLKNVNLPKQKFSWHEFRRNSELSARIMRE